MKSLHLLNIMAIASILLFSGCGRAPQKESTHSISYMKSHRIKNSAPAALNKNLKELTLEELYEVKNYYKENNNLEMALKALEQMLSISSDQKELQELRLEVAELHFDKGNMEKAAKLYSNYLTLYPGDKKHEEDIKCKQILCYFYLTLSSDRDQSMTQETLTLAQAYLNNKEFYQKYVEEIEDIRHKCCQKLFDGEEDRFNFYLTQGSYLAAEKRLEFMREKYIILLEDIEPYLINLEIKLANYQGNEEKVLAKQKELNLKFPEQGAVTMLAQNTEQKNYVNKF